MEHWIFMPTPPAITHQSPTCLFLATGRVRVLGNNRCYRVFLEAVAKKTTSVCCGKQSRDLRNTFHCFFVAHNKGSQLTFAPKDLRTVKLQQVRRVWKLMVQLLHLLHQRIVSPSMVETFGCKMGFIEVMSRCHRTAKQSHVAIYVSWRFNENALDAGLMWNVSTRGVPSWFCLHFTRHFEASNRETHSRSWLMRWWKTQSIFREVKQGKTRVLWLQPG